MSIQEIYSEKLLHEFSSWGNIEMRSIYEMTANRRTGHLLRIDLNKSSEYLYKETAAGERYLEASHHRESGKVKRYQHYFDGRVAKSIAFDQKDQSRQKSVSISRVFATEDLSGNTARPLPLKFYFAGQSPLYEEISKSQHLGQDRVLDRDCDKFLFVGIPWSAKKQDVLFYLDKMTGIPLRVDGFESGASLHSKVSWFWRAERLEMVQGRLFPMESKLSDYLNQPQTPDNDGALVIRVSVKSVEFGAKFSSDAFQAKVQPQATIHDTINRKLHNPSASASASASEAAHSASSVQAVMPSTWSDVLSSLAFISAIGFFILAFVFWRKRS